MHRLAPFLKNKAGRKALLIRGLGILATPIDMMLMAAFPGMRNIYLDVPDPAAFPIFIVSPPRAGSTLVYQYLCQALSVRYISGFWEVLPQSGRYLGFGMRRPAASFDSFFGNSVHLNGPHEGGRVVGQWFPAGPTHACQKLGDSEVIAMRRYFRDLSSRAGRPVLIKNVRNAVRVAALRHALPDARFIRIRRPCSDIAASVARGDATLMRSRHETFTVKPEDWVALRDLPIHERASQQVASIEAALDRDLAGLDQDRLYDLSFEAFCKTPWHMTLSIAERFPPIEIRPDMPPDLKQRTFTAR